MGLKKYKLGSFLELFNEKCNIPNLSNWDISGVNSDKEFFEPSRQVGEDTTNYKKVPPNHFACNLMHVGRDKVLPIALNHTQKTKIVSPAYSIFRIKDDTPLLRDYFFIMLKSDERDRYFWFHTDASIRDGMAWDDFCELEIELPSLDIQQKYVNVYKAMLANQQAYECGLEDLKLTCDASIEEIRRNSISQAIGKYISEINVRNTDLNCMNVQGVNSSSEFGETRADTNGLDFKNYKLVKTEQFAYNPSRINLGSIALFKGKECIVSPMYTVFEVSNTEKLLPKYVMLWFARKEFQRSTLFYATGSVRDTFSYDLMENVEIPIPSVDIQRALSNLYDVYIKRKEIYESLKTKTTNICPILIKGSIEEARKEA